MKSIVCTWERTPGSPCGDATYWYKVGTRSEVVQRIVTYPEATISGALNGCTLRNGWCSTMPVLSLTASEPVSGYAITLIEGTRNGEAFACSGASCDVPLLEGENNFTFWALSSWGDSSQMGSLSARVDTVPPQIEGNLSGTPGEAGWYVSPVTFTASASDPQPGSGIDTFTYSLNASSEQPYTGPITVSDGVHTLTFRAQDLAGHVSEISQNVQVDTLPPQVNASLAGEQANGWYLSQVTFTAAASDDGSGLARIEYALDGASWQAYTAPVTVGDGIHMLRVRALDVAGNQAEMVPLTFQVDGTPPQIRLTPSWYLWERGEVDVQDGESGLVGVEVEIRDPQGRWPKVVRSYEASGGSFAAGIEWDRRFADGTLAPIGSYEVVVKAWDRAGNFGRQTASIHIPAPNAPTYTPAPAPTVLPVIAEVSSPTSVPLQLAMETAIPTPTVLVSGFRTVATPPVESQSRTSPTGAGHPPVLWGMAALGAIGAATAYALGQRRKRKEEEARQAAEASAEAARRNAAEAARRVQNWLQGQAMLQNALNNPALNDAEKQGVQSAPKNRSLPDPETADMTEKERLSLYRQSERYRAYQERMQAWEAERKRQQAAAAYQAYCQGEWAEPQPQYGEWVPACTPTNPYGIPPATQPALDWLINLYRRDDLPGKTALERTQYILQATQSAPFQHFANIPSGDSGFASYYQDSSVWPQSSNQVGHYLTGLDISIRHHLGNDWKSKHFGLAAVIGHELIGDTLGFATWFQILYGKYVEIRTGGKVKVWFEEGGDDNLKKILDFQPFSKWQYFHAGNSLQDLRLSRQAWLDGKDLVQGKYSTPYDFAKRLEELKK